MTPADKLREMIRAEKSRLEREVCFVDPWGRQYPPSPSLNSWIEREALKVGEKEDG